MLAQYQFVPRAGSAVALRAAFAWGVAAIYAGTAERALANRLAGLQECCRV